MNTPDNITKLNPGEIFVFGSNESGDHLGGAARIAYEKFGALWGLGFGPSGQTFAIPTMDWKLSPLPLDVINTYIQRFKAYAKLSSNLTFYFTKIGCGIAGFSIDQIASMLFCDGIPSNIIIPKEFTECPFKVRDKVIVNNMEGEITRINVNSQFPITVEYTDNYFDLLTLYGRYGRYSNEKDL